MRIALKVDVSTIKGLEQGVPPLLKLFDEYNIRATFYFSMGKDKSLKTIKQIFTAQFLSSNIGQSLLDQWDWKAKIFAPDIAKQTLEMMKRVNDAGHEIGIGSFNPAEWIEEAAWADEQWTVSNMDKAYTEFERIFSEQATTQAAALWQINAEMLAQQQLRGLKYSSDCRGLCAFYPELQGVRSNVIQMPTTLPTLDELFVESDNSVDDLHEILFDKSQKLLPDGQVFTMRAELEGMHMISTVEKLLVMWKGSSKEVGTLWDIVEDIDLDKVPTHHIGWGQVRGREKHIAMQAKEVIL